MPGSMGPGMMGGNPFMSMGPGMMPGTMGPSMMPGSMGPGMMPGGMMPGGMGPGMMPGSMGPGMMPRSMGGMGPGMMPGGMGGMGPSHVGIMMEEMPNQRILDDRRLPPMPMPWPGAPMPLMPGQATGMGPDNLHALQQHSLAATGQAQRLPNAYRMYGYGNREITWSSSVPVHEHNTGIMINAEFPLTREQEGREVFHCDYGIRNKTWQHQGPWVQPLDPRTDIPDWKTKQFGSYELAVDCKKPRYKKEHTDEHYKGLHKARAEHGLFTGENAAKKNMRLEIMDEGEVANFWGNPAAVMSDRLEK